MEKAVVISSSVLRILVIEDNAARIACFQAWKPEDVHFVFVTSPGPALGLIKRDRGLSYAGVMLDHDLDEQRVCASEIEYSGTQVAAAIIEDFSYEIPILIHSMNYARARAMEKKLTHCYFSVTRIPMEMLTERSLNEWLVKVRENWGCTVFKRAWLNDLSGYCLLTIESGILPKYRGFRNSPQIIKKVLKSIQTVEWL